MVKGLDDIMDAFQTGKTPTGQDYLDLLTACFNISDVQFYNSDGVVNRKLKIYFGTATTTDYMGNFVVDYSHVGYANVLVALANPYTIVHDPNFYEALLTSTITHTTDTHAYGSAFVSRDIAELAPGLRANIFAPEGTLVQCFIIGY